MTTNTDMNMRCTIYKKRKESLPGLLDRASGLDVAVIERSDMKFTEQRNTEFIHSFL